MSVSLSAPFNAPETQRALLLHAPREAYKIAEIPLPALEKEDEVLIRIEAIGLNPVYVVTIKKTIKLQLTFSALHPAASWPLASPSPPPSLAFDHLPPSSLATSFATPSDWKSADYGFGELILPELQGRADS